MHKLKSIIWIRPIAVVILIVSAFLFTESYFIGNYLQEITGTKASGRIALIDFFKGEIGFKDVLIYSPEKYYGGVKALYIKKITIKPEWLSLFSSKKMMKDVSIDGIVINNIYNSLGESNIKDILGHSADQHNSGKSDNQYTIQRFSLRHVFLNTFYRGRSPINSRLPDISIKDIKSGNGLVNTIGTALTLSLNAGFEKNDGRSFWQRTGDVVGTGFNITMNILNIGTSPIGTAELEQ